MSIQAVAWVLDQSQARGFARLVLISLANHADKTDGECYPAQRTIAAEAGISRAAVPAQIAKLTELGELEVIDPGTPRRSARYRLTFVSAQEVSADADLSAQPEVSAAPTPGVSRTITEPSSNQQDARRSFVHVSDLERELASDFDAWWLGYPRKVDKARARARYNQQRRNGATAFDLTRARDAYAGQITQHRTEERFVKHAATFLNESWRDYLEQPPEREKPMTLTDLQTHHAQRGI